MNKIRQEVVSVALTVLIVLMLIFSAPAGAVNVTLTVPNQITAGESLNFKLRVDLESGERIPIKNITFKVTCGTFVKEYAIYANGTKISGEVEVTGKSSNASYGYGTIYGYGYLYGYGYGYITGYGYGYGNTAQTYMEYSVSIKDTSSYPTGACLLEVFVWTDGKAFYNKKGFNVVSPPAPPAGVLTPGVTFTDNVLTITVGYIPKGQEKGYIVPEDSTLSRYISNVTVIAKERSLAGFAIKIKLLDKLPEEIPPIENAYKFFEITSPIKEGFEAKIAFKVEKGWIEENNIDKNKVYMYRYREAWERLDTQKVGEDDKYVYYEAVTHGFSYYTIAGEKITEAVAPPTKEEVKPPKPPEVKPPKKPPEVKPPEVKPPAPTPVPPKPAWIKYVIIAVIAAAIITLIAVAYLRKKKE